MALAIFSSVTGCFLLPRLKHVAGASPCLRGRALQRGRVARRPFRLVAVCAASEGAESSRDAPFALIVPGFLGDASDFQELALDMTKAGYRAEVVPISWWHWLPCVGGRSMRPILERIDHAVNRVLANGCNIKSVQEPAYTPLDFITDFTSNPGGFLKVGGSADPAEYPEVQPSGADFTAESRERWSTAAKDGSGGARIALVAHSAAGWISRLYLSSVSYSGRTYDGASKLHSLVCLGSPHFPAESIAFSALKYLEQRGGSGVPASVRCLCVGSSGTTAREASDMTRGAYKMCGAEPDEATADGDGMTPLFSALAWDGAEKLKLEGVTHAPAYPAFGPSAELSKRRSEGQPWYGSANILEEWLPWLRQR